MKVLHKILLICFAIFLLIILVTKISIDQSFKKAECDKISSEDVSFTILQKTKQV